MKIEAVIVDDEPRAIELLEHYIGQVDQLELKQSFRDPFKAFHYLNRVKVDLLFLDISMPRLSGLDLFKNLSVKPSVIFTTAHSEYAINGYNLDAIDYLLKPISYIRFLKAVQKFEKLSTNLNLSEKIPADLLYIKSGSVVHKLFWRDVKYLEKEENYVIFHLLNGKQLLSRATISEFEKTFPSYVLRVHKSFAVCLFNISTVEKKCLFVGDSKIPIGRKYKEAFHLVFGEYMLV